MLILYCYRPLVGVKDDTIDQTLCFADDLQSFALFFCAQIQYEKSFTMNLLKDKIKEALFSVMPVVAIVFLLAVTPLANFTGRELGVFGGSAVLMVLGIGLFSLGADMFMTPIGDYIGSGLTKSKKMWLILGVSFAMGVFITVAEPDLSVLAEQVAGKIGRTALIVTVGAGVGLFLVVAVLKIVSKKSLSNLLAFFYMVLFSVVAVLVETGNADFLAMSFDSGGVTTGPITVPFIMAFGVGISQTIGGRNADENSFGLVALCSIGPVLAVMLLGLLSTGDVNYTLSDYSVAENIWLALGTTSWKVVKEVAIALGLIVVFFAVLQVTYLKIPTRKLKRIAMGLLYTFLGLVIFLTAVSVGFMPIGYKLGQELSSESNWVIVLVGFVIGMVVVLAEPAIHVLNKQVEEVTNRTVSKRSMLIALSVGVGLSIGLSMLRMILGFSILYYLIPGYIISIGLSFFVPGMYTAIAFDSGGVASGPLTSSFILPLAIGVCVGLNGGDVSRVLTDAFGIVAMVAMTPLITIQLLGFRAVVAKRMRDNYAQKRIVSADDEQIIYFR